MNETFMKEKPVLPLLLSMALPNVVSMLVNSLYNIVDSLFVARISEDAMTALSLVFPIQNFSNAIAIGFGIGINAMIALYLGAGDREKAEIAATHGFVLSLVHGVVMMVVSIAIMPGFLRRFTQDETLIAAGITYSTIVFLFLVVNMVSLAFEKIFQAVGRMKVSMVALITGCVCNILLDPVFILPWGLDMGACHGHCRRSTGYRHRSGAQRGGLPCGLPAYRAAGAAAPQLSAPGRGAGRQTVRHRRSGHPESGAALAAGHLP